MALPINIEDLLNKRKVESNRIEFKKGWNPDKIYHTICAFATDLENTGGGYILVGVEQSENGIAKRPVEGLPLESIDGILTDMVGYDSKISSSNLRSISYNTKVSVEEVDGKTILAIWVPTGPNRPYCVSESVVAKSKSPLKYYIRSKASTIEARGETLDEVRALANRIPFDECGNETITIDDISGLLVYEHLKAAKKLKARRYRNRRLGDFLKELDLTEGRATGIPTIQKSLRSNGSPKASIETDDDRTYFLMTIPCREDFSGEVRIGKPRSTFEPDEELGQILGQAIVQVKDAVNQSNISEKGRFGQLLGQLFVQVWKNTRDKDMVPKFVIATIDLLCLLNESELTANAIAQSLKIGNTKDVKRKIIFPLIENGILTMTNPDKPTSSKQKYTLTESGRRLFEL